MKGLSIFAAFFLLAVISGAQECKFGNFKIGAQAPIVERNGSLVVFENYEDDGDKRIQANIKYDPTSPQKRNHYFVLVNDGRLSHDNCILAPFLHDKERTTILTMPFEIVATVSPISYTITGISLSCLFNPNPNATKPPRNEDEADKIAKLFATKLIEVLNGKYGERHTAPFFYGPSLSQWENGNIRIVMNQSRPEFANDDNLITGARYITITYYGLKEMQLALNETRIIKKRQEQEREQKLLPVNSNAVNKARDIL